MLGWGLGGAPGFSPWGSATPTPTPSSRDLLAA